MRKTTDTTQNCLVCRTFGKIQSPHGLIVTCQRCDGRGYVDVPNLCVYPSSANISPQMVKDEGLADDQVAMSEPSTVQAVSEPIQPDQPKKPKLSKEERLAAFRAKTQSLKSG